MNYFCCKNLQIYEQNSSRILFRQSSFCSGSYLKSINKIFEKYRQRNPFLKQAVPNLSTKSLKNTWEVSGSVSMNKIFEIHRWRGSCFQFTIESIFLSILLFVLNAPLFKCLTSVSIMVSTSRDKADHIPWNLEIGIRKYIVRISFSCNTVH